MKITELSLKRPVAVMVLMLSVYVLGIISLVTLPVNLLPTVVYPLVKVNIAWRGATPEDIENQIADVVEPKISTVDNLDYITTTCMDGFYELLVYFDYNADRDVAYQDVMAKMGIVRKNLPKDADEPTIIKADPSQLPVMDLLVTSGGWDPVKLRTWTENYLNLLFVSVPGTAGTDVSGGMKREIRVLADPYRMQAKGVNADLLARRLKDENIELSGGRVTTGRKEFLVRTKAEFLNTEEIKNTVVSSDKYGKTVYVKDIAEVKDTGDIQRIKTKLNSKEGVKLSIFKQVAANTLDVEAAIRGRIKEIQPLLPPGVKISEIYTQGAYIRAANKGVRDAALIAMLLVVLVTWFFLGTWKRTLVIALSMPVSMLITFFCMKLSGFSFNIFSLGGLILAITIILDDSVIVLENITRHQEDEIEGRAARQAPQALITQATNEVSQALLFAVLTFVALFLPFLLVPGLATLLFRELVIIVSIAVFSSRVVSITITPLLVKLFHEQAHAGAKPFGEELLERLKEKYRATLLWALERRKGVMALTALFFALGLFSFMSVGREFLPQADDGQITVKVKMPSGSSMQETEKALSNIEKKVKDLPFMSTWFSIAGGRAWGLVTYELANEGEVDLQLVPKGERDIGTVAYLEKYGEEIQKSAQYPGAKVKVFHTKMKGIMQTGDYDVEVEIYAPKTMDINDLYALALKTSAGIKDVKGLTALDVSIDVSKPEYQLILNRAKAADLGFSAAQAADLVKTYVDGKITTNYKDGGYYYPVRLVVDEAAIGGKEDIANMPMLSPRNLPIYLRDLGKLVYSIGPVEIQRKDQMRLIKVTASVVGADVGKTTDLVYKKVAAMPFPPGVYVKAGGQAKMMADNFKALAAVLLLALFFAYVILAIQFESFAWPALILARIPLSLIGITVALLLTGSALGVTVIIGILILSGIEILHGVMLLTFIQELMEKGLPLKKAVMEGASLRLRPILMTFCVGIMGLVPLALGLGEGTELLKPMAIAVIGGLLFSMYLTFYFMPAAFTLLMERKRDGK
ncbi:MAG: efflux RND transporter permease subunit [Elusimicrobia bacterium]|nr:efflux RND transporter permease subunit [Elusimicrobiota bacterium]